MCIRDSQYPLDEGEFERFLQDAKTLGVKIECLGSLPKNEEYANIYILAMRECLTNGVCHAGATELSITMQENDDFYRIRITNNGVAQMCIRDRSYSSFLVTVL